MTKPEALRMICKDDRNEQLTRASYARVKRALKVLAFSEEEQTQALRELEYLGLDDQPHAFLVEGRKS